jgi:sugar/nucleoside kinase (ribokinase family)
MTRASTARADRPSHDGAIDYLIIGHVTVDITPEGPRIGGTAAYAGLTASRLGLEVGLVTACETHLDLSPLEGLAIERRPSASTTTFENKDLRGSRRQILRSPASHLTLADVPNAWRGAPIVHLAPVAGEIDPMLADAFPDSFVGVTPQGWWRAWDDAGTVRCVEIEQAMDGLVPAHAAVFSRQDLALDATTLERLRQLWPVVAITDGAAGADVYWQDEQLHIPATSTTLVDDTGAGDIFAAVLFAQLSSGRPPDAAAKEATRWASASVRRAGLAGVEDPDRAGIPAGAPPQ